MGRGTAGGWWMEPIRALFLLLLAVVCSCSGGESGAGDSSSSPKDMTAEGAATPDLAADDAATMSDSGPREDGMPDTGEEKDLPAEVSAETVPPEPFEPAVCGAQPYSWLPSSDVGDVVLWEESLFSNLTTENIDEMYAEGGYTKMSPVPHGVRNFRLRYTTQDRGKKVEATTMVGVPLGIDPTQPLPIILWLHPTTGVNDACAPTADPLMGPGQTTVVSSQGYVSVAPDFLGMRGFGEPSPEGEIHPYLVAEPTAISALDAVRAAVVALNNSEEQLATPDTSRIGLYGGSQGGHACFFVDRYAPHYAPELNVMAVSAVVPGLDVLAMAHYIGSNFGDAAITLMPVLTTMRYWYGHPADMTQVLTDQEPHFLASTIENSLAQYCALGDAYPEFESLDQIYTPEFLEKATAEDWDGLEPWSCLLRENSVPGISVPRLKDTPILATFATNDTLVVADVQREAAKKLCQEGYRIEFIECADENHVSGGIVSIHYSFNWLKDRLDGKEMDPEKVCDFGPAIDCNTL